MLADQFWVDVRDFLGQQVAIPNAGNAAFVVNALENLSGSEALISLPMPDGTMAQFRFVESPVMEPELAARFPEIKTYRGRGVDDPTATVRFDLTPAGFHAQVLSRRGASYVEPYLRGDTNLHAVYYRQDCRPAAEVFQCMVSEDDAVAASPASLPQVAVPGGALRLVRQTRVAGRHGGAVRDRAGNTHLASPRMLVSLASGPEG